MPVPSQNASIGKRQEILLKAEKRQIFVGILEQKKLYYMVQEQRKLRGNEAILTLQ